MFIECTSACFASCNLATLQLAWIRLAMIPNKGYAYPRAGLFNWRPVDQIRPPSHLHPARGRPHLPPPLFLAARLNLVRYVAAVAPAAVRLYALCIP